MTGSKEKPDFSFNPFVGPHPIETGRNIFGRNREIDDLYYLLSAERIVMLHSPSGAGKTSLIQAGLIPRLNERFDVWGPTRVNQLPSANSPATVNRYIRSAVLGFEQQIPADRRRNEEQLAGMTLTDYVANRPRRRSAPQNIVLIFDQFEEILTADPLAIEAKREFFKQLGELLLDPRIWALFAMREDYLPALDPYAEQVPTHLKNWFRLDLLRRDKATEAITETAKEGGRQFDSDAVMELVTDLATMKVQQPDGTFAPQKGLYVEPLQLQVVCRRLWERMPADKQTIDQAEIEQSGDVTTALADYYAAEVARLANGDVRVERKLREWVGEKLITPDSIRSQVLRGAGNSEGLDNELIANLVNTHLVRGEQREGATWYELAHDRLIEPIRNNNRDWFDTHLHKVQKLASLWEREGRPDGLLLLGGDLIEAKEWSAQNETSLTAIESKFMEASVAKQEAIEKEERQSKRLRRLARGLNVVGGIAAIFAVFAYTQYLSAEQNLTQSRRLLYVANQLLAWNAFDQQNYYLANNSLEESFPDHGASREEDRRSFDWFYLWGQAHNEIQTLKGHAIISSVSFSPDGRTLASGSENGTVRLWDVASGQEKAPLKSYAKTVVTVSFSPDGRTLASGGDTVKLWDVASGQEKATLKGHAAEVKSVSFSPDGRTLASGGDTVKLWDVASGQEKATLKGHAAGVYSVSFSPDGQTLASGGDTVKLWDIASGQEKVTLKGHAPGVNSVSFSPDGKTLASASCDNTVKLWDVASGQEMAALKGHTWCVLSVSFSPDGKTLASASWDSTVKLWDVASGQEKATLKGHASRVWSVSFSPNGRTLASWSWDGTMKLWDVVNSQEKATLISHTDQVQSLSFSPNGRMLASGSGDKMVRLWDLASNQEKLMLKGHADTVNSVSFSPNDQTLASGSYDKTVKLWDVASGQEKATLKGHMAGVNSVSFSPDGRTLASGSSDGAMKLWDVASGHEKLKLKGHSDSVNSVSFSPDGRTLASGSRDGTVKLWNVTSGQENAVLQGYTSSVSFSPDGQTLASGSFNGLVILWDVVMGQEKAVLHGHPYNVSSVSFSPDGRTLASGSLDSTVRLWDVASGKELRKLEGHTSYVLSLAFSPDGRTLVSGGGGEIEKDGKRIPFGEILIWRGATDDKVRRQCIRCGRKD